jgi:putative DNA primase/helicase
MNAIEDFRETMHSAGLDYTGILVADGTLHRFKASGDHARNSWYLLHQGAPAAGAFGCWKRGIKETWCERNNTLSTAEWQNVRQHWAEAERERVQTENKRRLKARETAAWILSRSHPARSEHPYLTRKGVKSYGDLRARHGALVLPLRDADGEQHSQQFIREAGEKRFLTGGRIAGCYYTVADNGGGPLVICEGYATGASIHEATGHAVVCAMHAGNLKTVAVDLCKKYSDREIIIAADNDQFTDGNPGLTKATEAAAAIRAKLAVPQFQDVSTKPTDFNDLHRLAGLNEVARLVHAAAVPAPAIPVGFHPEPETVVTNSPVTPPGVGQLVDAPKPFPIECLPPALARMAQAVAVTHRVPVAMPAMMVLAAVGASLGKGLKLDWRPGKAPTPANLYLIQSAASGSGKSECSHQIFKPFLDFEQAMQERWHKEVMPQLQADLRYHEGKLKKLDRVITKDSTSEADAEHCRSEIVFHQAQVDALKLKLHEPQLSIQDATVEKVATVLYHNDEQIFSISADARKLCDNLLGRYSANKKLADDGIYLSAFSGDYVKVDRQGRDGVRLTNPCMNMFWALQPDALEMLMDEASLQQGGFLARCLMAHTHAEPQRIGDDVPPISDDVRTRWSDLINTLLTTFRQPSALPATTNETMDEPI